MNGRFEEWFNSLTLHEQWEYVVKLFKSSSPLFVSTLESVHTTGACWSIEQLVDSLRYVVDSGATLRLIAALIRK